ncbi:hypothetical protein [Streptomyces sp. KL116D]|uniref:hypothetical protein n=1 Tax=Streptomyces sp. KL116D TaxID=3045152 RepID=UPI0035579AF9
MEWFEHASAAETAGDWDIAIDLVSARAECCSTDYNAHGNHLWHMDLLVRAQRLDELAERAGSDVHARRRLNRALRAQERRRGRLSVVAVLSVSCPRHAAMLLSGTNPMDT